MIGYVLSAGRKKTSLKRRNKEGVTMKEKVRVYSTPGCPFCKMTKEFLSQKGVEFTDYDVTKDRDALQEMRKITGGARSVPVIAVCNEVMIGFDPGRLEQALNCLKQSSEIPE